MRSVRSGVLSWLLASLLAASASAAPPVGLWQPYGPDGGDARRIVPDPRDPRHLYLGTAVGWIYESRNGGANWTRLAQVGKRDDLVLDSIVVDAQNPRHLIVGAWVIDHSDGGLYFSYDGGASWSNQAQMRGQSVLSLAASQSDPRIMVAGTLRGVFRTEDGGQHWAPISPENSNEIHNVQSVAIDPKDPKVIYVGTWHLPWKTEDAGEHWNNIKKGIIDDSDVFSIIVDPDQPQTVFASACSGIYRSDNAGEEFSKVKEVQGIPSSARRTRRLLQDPSHLEIVFAGTTEGLYRSQDGGKTWSRTTGPDVIVNDIAIDAADPHHVLIATDRGGVLASDDGGDTFHSSNGGFSARQVLAMIRDNRHPETLFVGVVNDKDWGGVFQSENGGMSWTQRSAGLDGRDVFALAQASDGALVAGTAHGLFRMTDPDAGWARIENAPNAAPPRAKPSSDPAELPQKPRPSPASVAHSRLVAAHHAPESKSRGHAAPARNSGSSKHAASGRHAPASAHGRTTAATRAAAAHRPAAHGKASLARTKAAPAAPKQAPAAPRKAAVAEAGPAAKSAPFDGAVYAIASSGTRLLATTSVGLLASEDNGATWTASAPSDALDWRFISASKDQAVIASLHAAALSQDSGATWQPLTLPPSLTQVSATSILPSGEIWLGGREGVFVSSDKGATWTTPRNLFLSSVTSIVYDDAAHRIMIATRGNSSLIFTVTVPDKAVTFTDTGWNIRMALPVGDRIVAATLYDGIVVQPRMVASPMLPAAPQAPARSATAPAGKQ